MLLAISFLVAGLYLILFVFTMNTKNFISTVIFKFIPFVIGLFNILYAIKLFGWLSQ